MGIKFPDKCAERKESLRDVVGPALAVERGDQLQRVGDGERQSGWRVVGVVSCVKDGTDDGVGYRTSSLTS